MKSHIQKEMQRRQIVSMLVFALIQLTSLITPYLMGKIIDVYIPTGNTGRIIGGLCFSLPSPC